MKNGILLLFYLVGIFGFSGCRTAAEPDYGRALPPGQMALRKIIDPAKIPDFTIACRDLNRLGEGIENSLNYLSKPSSRDFYPYGQITHEHAVTSLEAFAQLIAVPMAPGQLNQTIRQQFDVYTSVGWVNEGTVLYTGYYTPVFDGSEAQTGLFRYPLYKAPENLVKGRDGEVLGLQSGGGQFTLVPSRVDLPGSGLLTGQELVWLSDPFEVYIAQVQGSAKIRLPGGELVTAGYTATNGHPYHSIAKDLIDDGRIAREDLNLDRLIRFFKQNPGMIDQYVNRNPRFVFFDFFDAEPRGSLNEMVIPYRTIATDKSIYPRACLTLINTKLAHPTGYTISDSAYSGFALDQDSGGAIRAPGRCDVYMGQGKLAGRCAGQTYEAGRLYYLFLKQESASAFNTIPAPTESPVR